MGSISRLGSEIGEQQDFDDRSTHNKQWTLAYHRDRGEDLISDIYHNVSSWIEYSESYADYNYLWNHDAWYINMGGQKDHKQQPTLTLVSDILINKSVND